ncbi:MAG: DsrE family protein [Hyphomicrobiales bacterium]|nr:DsrE family protein [Hyphomicrobiales bacterium]
MLRIAAAFAAILAFAMPASAQVKKARLDDGPRHRLIIQVNDNDPQKMNLALNNAANVSSYFAGKGEEVDIEIVAYGPGLNMLIASRSPVSRRVASFQKGMPNVAFTACGNTMRNMKKKTGKDVVLISNIKVVPAGVTRIMELQEKGWSYLKP